MQTSGLLLDVYDDYSGDVIRELFPTIDTVPGFVKQAHALSSEERALLPDDAFALVLVNEGQRLRKYACTDPGNTALSVLYFNKNGHKLPLEAQKVAAANLSKACAWYELGAPEIEKIALAVWAARKAGEQIASHPFTALNIAMSGPALEHTAQQMHGEHQTIKNIRASEGGTFGGRPISQQEIDEARFSKQADLTGTDTMPISRAPVSPGKSKTTVVKSAAIGRLVAGHRGESGAAPNVAAENHPEQPDAHPQMKAMKPHVDVTGKEPAKSETEKKASYYALGSKYPLDSYQQVKTASAYFNEYGRRFVPEDRREYCLNLLKHAEALNVEVSDDVRHYGSTMFAPDEELKVACDLRRGIITDERFLPVLDGLYEKRAEIGPEMYAATLAEFDKLAGIDFHYDREIPDPYYSTFHKVAEPDFSEVIGNETITEATLKYLARVGAKTLRTTFGEDFVVEFQKDPVAIFKSMPRDQKVVIMRMASDNSGPGVALQA